MRRRSGGTTTAGEDSTRSPTRISPPPAARKPATSRSVVVLPQPDGPEQGDQLARPHLEVEADHRADVAEALGEAGDA